MQIQEPSQVQEVENMAVETYVSNRTGPISSQFQLLDFRHRAIEIQYLST